MRYLPPDDTDIGYVLHGGLSPCPFCGGFPVTASRVNDETGIHRGIVSCTKCDAQVGYNDRTRVSARNRAVANWERRK